MKRLIYAFVFVLSLENVLTCPSGCSCSTDSQGLNVYCNNTGLAKIPTDIPADVFSLVLKYNQITEIDEHVFSNMSKVHTIDLDRNLISTIPSGAFNDLHNLHNIYLDNNNISTIQEYAFNNLTALYDIRLNDNHIVTLKAPTFVNLPNLRYLNLDDNNIVTLEEDTFVNVPYLNQINFQYNRVSTIKQGAFDDLSRCEIMYLQYHEMYVIQKNAFVGLQVRAMYMRSNKIAVIESGAFSNSTILYSLYLDYNNISGIQEDAFNNLTALNYLRLDYNNIVTFEAPTFVNLPYLEYIYLEYNKLKTTGSGVFKDLPLLYSLNLQDNEIATIDEDSFVNLPNLRYLHLDRNNITVVKKGAFANLTNLYHLSFQMYCDCINIDFWKWITTVDKYATSVRCYDHENRYLASLLPCSFAKCSADPCYSNPCSYNGVCMVGSDGRAFCTCHGLWTGQHCEVSPCSTWNCGEGQCYYNESGFSTCVDPLHQQCPDTTTEDTTASTVPSTSPVTCQPCTGGGGLNRTNMALGGRCGVHSVDGKCTVPNSACMQSRTDTTWKCRCAQGYAEKNSNCAEIPNRLFSSQQKTVTIPKSTSTGSTVTTILFSGVSGFSTSSLTASVIGQGSSIFNVDVNTTGATLKLNGQFDQYNYIIILTTSVTIDNFVVRDFVEIRLSVTPDTLIRDDIVIVDGTPEGSVVGQLCQSCFTGSDVISTSISNIVKVNSDGSIVTSKAINLDTIQNGRTIAYSTNILVHKNSNPIGNLTVIVIRPQYTLSLSEDSTSKTQLGVVNLDQPFTIYTDGLDINGQTLSLGSTTLNYEGETELEKQLLLTISGTKQHSLDVSVTIKVLDVNDEAPRFLKSNYNFLTIQSAYSNLVVGVVTAQDSDLDSDLKYSLAENKFLTIDDYGVIRIKNTSIDQANYTVIVSVTDSKFTSSASVSIDLLPPANVNLKKKFTWNIPENGISNKSVHVDDYKNFHFTDQMAQGDFTLDPTTGVIQNRRQFDRENPHEKEFKYTVVANKKNEATCSLVIIGEITITITDVNDEPPVFVYTPYTATVKEESSGEALVMNPISTTDEDLAPTVTYSLLNNADKFSINSNTGVITTKAQLDRETTPTLTVGVKAYDGVNSATVTVTVTLEDVNDNDPVFTGTYQFEITENSPLKTVIGSVAVNDADEGKNAEISFDLISNGGFFRINQTTGEITLSRMIDRESTSSQVVIVYARDNGEPIRSTSMTTTIDVKDVNDNAPVFAENYINVEFEEGKACNIPVTTIVATDTDKPNTLNSQIKYSVISGSEHVEIEPSSGVLRCKSPFDHETVSSVTILIKAEDSPNDGKLSSNQTVIINVKDINDNTPVFVDPKSEVTIRYFTTGRVVEVVNVADSDSGKNGQVDLTISGTASIFLTIESNGIISTEGTQTPSDGTYSLVITATDRGVPPKFNSTTMQIELESSVTQPISFSQQEINMNIEENSVTNTDVESVAPKVNKPVGVTAVKYEIIDEKDDLPFQVHLDTGMVTVKSAIDRESRERHEFVLRVTNTVTAEQSDLALVKIQILDVNDNPPIFEQSEYFYNVREDVTANTAVAPNTIKIKASDADTGTNALITFEILSGSDSCFKKFDLKDEGASIKSIVLSETIDYEMYQTCKFSIKAYNQNKQTMNSTVTVDVNILDYNDNTPKFLGHTNGVYNIFIPEDTTINTEIPLIGGLQDEDSRENGDIELFNVNGDCLFNVSTYDKKIRLQLKSGANIDYETDVRTNECTIRARDKGSPSLSATATVNITITDVNDNRPLINQPDIKTNVSRDAVNGDVVVNKIPATDDDSSENGQLIYSMKSSEYSSKFIINPDTGEITVNSPISSVQADQITIRAIVSDKGTPPLSSTATVTIKILDDNPRPYLEQPSPINITEHSQRPDGKIVTVKAFDRVNGKIESCGCRFRLDTNRDDLTIDNDGVIKFKDIDDSFDREREPNNQVSVSVIAQDKENPPKDSRPMVITITILDINDQSPFFQQEIYNFNVFQKAPNGSSIGTVAAIDKDINPVTHYSMNITEGGFDPSVVSINQTTGEITKTGDLTLNQTSNTQIKGWVYAQDSKDQFKRPDVSQVIITIEFDDKNKHTPLFDKNLYTPDLSWDADVDHLVVKVSATDNDTGVEGDVTYSISSGNNRGFFKVDKDGTVLLAYKLDSSIGSSSTEIVNLIITATDGGIISKFSKTTVRIRISGSNPGSCIQSLSHQNALDLVEGERDSWTIALFIVVALLCVAILCSLIFLYKWRTSTAPTVSQPFDTDHKLKYVSNETAYSELGKRQTVEYSHSNEGFIPPDPYNTPTDDIGEVELEPRPDYPAYEWASDATRVLPTRAPTSFGSSS